jgi:4-oxalocrotonate tautomerase
MPMVRISVLQGTAPEYRRALSDGVQRAMVEAMQVPADDHFHVVTEHPPGGIVFSPSYLGISHSDRIVFVQVTLSTGRKPPQKRAFFRRLKEILAESPGVPPQDLIVNLVEVSWENWSFGNGAAQYMDA